MGEAVQENGVESGVAEDDFEHTLRGGVLAENGVDLFPDGAKHLASHYNAKLGKPRSEEPEDGSEKNSIARTATTRPRLVSAVPGWVRVV